MGFWNSMESGIMRRVTKSHRVHTFCQSWMDGTPKGEDEYGSFEMKLPDKAEALGDDSKGNMNGGRSSSHSEYWETLSTQRWMGRNSASVNST